MRPRVKAKTELSTSASVLVFVLWLTEPGLITIKLTVYIFTHIL